MNHAVAKIADQEVAADVPKARCCNGQPPGRVQRGAAGGAADEGSVGVIGVDEAEARSGLLVLAGTLERVSDIQGSVDVLNVKGCVAGGQTGIGEVAGQAWVAGRSFHHVDGAGPEVRQVEIPQSAVSSVGEALVNICGQASLERLCVAA